MKGKIYDDKRCYCLHDGDNSSSDFGMCAFMRCGISV